MKKANIARIWLILSIVAAMLAGLALNPPKTVQALSANLVISQVYGGGGNSGAPFTHDYVEIFNRGETAVSLNGLSIQYTSATGTGNFGSATNLITPLPDALLQPGQYYLVQQASGGSAGAPLPVTPDLTDSSPINMSATGAKIALVNSTASLGCNGSSTTCSPAQLALIIDLVGWGTANFFESSPAPTTSNTTAIFRNGNGCVETDNNGADFSAAAPAPRNSASPFNVCSAVAPTSPSGAGSAAPASLYAGEMVTLTVSVIPGDFPPSTGLNVSADLSAIGGANPQPFFDDGSNGDVSAGDLIFTYATGVDPATSPGSKTLSVSISDAEGRSGSSSISLLVSPPLVAIHAIQGAAHTSPYVSQLVSTQGIVIARAARGFYMQQPNPDADDATSEGLFVFTSSAPTVQVGDLVLVTGTVTEFRPGGSGGTNNLTLTEIDNPGRTVTVLSSGNPLPDPVIIGAGGRVPPTEVIDDDTFGSVESGGSFDAATDGIDFYESMEGMLVQVNDPVAVGPTNSFGEIPVLSDGGSLASIRTNRGGIVIRPQDFNPERIILDDTLLPTPIVNVGDTFTTPVVGVLDYSFGNFKLYITQPLTAVSGGLEREVAASGADFQLSTASFNVENLNPNDPPTKFAEIANLIVNHLGSPDILGLEEIQDNSGATNNGVVDADLTFNLLISAIQAAGGPVYEYRQINPVDGQDGGQPGGNIRVGFLFRPDRVSFVDRPGGSPTTATSLLSTPDGPVLEFSPGRLDPTNTAFLSSRKPLAGEFLFRGERVFVVTNHFNSKGGDQPLFGRFQPPALFSEAQRIQQAQVVAGFVSSLLSLDPEANIVVLGDLNDFEFSAPLDILKNSGLNALIETLPQEERYTYIFDGNSQVLDHILIGDRLLSAPFVYDVVHVNAEFADQASDHEPQVAFLCVDRTPPQVSLSVTPNTLWPPKHQYIQVSASVNASDNADPAPVIQLLSVTSNEPDNGLGDGDTANDIVIVDDFNFLLRAERAGKGNGRVYTITYQVSDGCGNTTVSSATVFVPRNRSGR
ncbi:MAG: lamin tail domain-containing protein [Bellilinea sp.]